MNVKQFLISNCLLFVQISPVVLMVASLLGDWPPGN